MKSFLVVQYNKKAESVEIAILRQNSATDSFK